MSYAYPLDSDWTKDEIIAVVELYAAVEQAYEQGIQVKQFKDKYAAFKRVASSISLEKTYDRAFEKLTHYSIYACRKKAQDLTDQSLLKMR